MNEDKNNEEVEEYDGNLMKGLFFAFLFEAILIMSVYGWYKIIWVLFLK